MVILAGAIAIPTLPLARYPDLTPPSVTVAAIYTGANAQAVESAVTTPLEQVINGVEGMQYMRSSSTNTGICTITVTFEIGRDAGPGGRRRAEPREPGARPHAAEVRTNGISVTKNTVGFIGAIGFYTDDDRYDSLFISNYLDLYARDAFKRVPGRRQRHHLRRAQVRDAAVARSGQARRARHHGRATSSMRCASRTSRSRPAASATRRRPTTRCTRSACARPAGSRPAPQFEDVVVKSGQDGALVRVKDVGRVELGAENYASLLRFARQGRRPASASSCCRRPTRFRCSTASRRSSIGCAQNFPPGLKAEIAFDNVTVVRESIWEVLMTLAEAIGLVVLVMFLFLQNWRSTIIPAITIPVSLIGTFAFVKLFGFSINTLTLFGIVLATGIVVDDAIVVIENIERHMREYKKRAHEAAIDAMSEVFSAVVVIGLVLVAVFVPVAFFPGTTGRMYQQFSLTIAFSVVLSVFNAVTFTPALSALLLDREAHAHGWFFRGVNRVIDGGTNFYVRALRLALRWRLVMLLVFVGGLAAHLGGLPRRAVVVRARRGRGLLHHDHPGAGRVVAGIHVEHRAAGRAGHHEAAGSAGGVLGRRLQLQRIGAEPGPDVRAAEGASRNGSGKSQSLAALRRAAARRADRRDRRARSSFPWRRRRFRGCRRSAGSSSRCSTDRARTSRTWRTRPTR